MPTLLFVAAHPDDDTFGVARTVALHAHDPDFRFVLVHATDGEAGEIAADSDVTRDRLGAERRKEAVASWEVMGRRPDRHEWLGLPDGELEAERDRLAAAVTSILSEERPDVVATFGPDGITGHPDHLAVSAVTTVAFMDLRADGGPGLRRLMHCAIPQSWVDRWNSERRAAGLEEWDPAEPFHLRGIPDDRIAVEVDTRMLIEKTIEAIRRHRTQWSYSTMDEDRALADSLRYEHWAMAWPPRPPGSAVLTDVFEGL